MDPYGSFSSWNEYPWNSAGDDQLVADGFQSSFLDIESAGLFADTILNLDEYPSSFDYPSLSDSPSSESQPSSLMSNRKRDSELSSNLIPNEFLYVTVPPLASNNTRDVSADLPEVPETQIARLEVQTAVSQAAMTHFSSSYSEGLVPYDPSRQSLTQQLPMPPVYQYSPVASSSTSNQPFYAFPPIPPIPIPIPPTPVLPFAPNAKKNRKRKATSNLPRDSKVKKNVSGVQTTVFQMTEPNFSFCHSGRLDSNSSQQISTPSVYQIPSVPLPPPLSSESFISFHLPYQNSQSSSPIAATKNSTSAVQLNINKLLQNVMPAIKELDSLYQEVCLAFANGKSPSKPEGMTQELMPYQWRGYKWMEILYQFGIGGCLADEMGLGKTIQSLALIQSIINQKKAQGDTAYILISCPSNLIPNWQREMQLNCPSLVKESFVLEGEGFDITQSICFVSHQKLRMLRPEKGGAPDFPFNQEWDLILFDEFHTFLNSTPSEQVVSLLRQKAKGPQRGFMALTGTPMPNNLMELYKLNAMLNPDIYPKKAAFKTAFTQPAKEALRNLLKVVQQNNGKIPQNYSLQDLEGYVVKLIEILAKPFMLRRLKSHEEFKSQTAIMQSRGGIVQVMPPLEPEMKVSYSFSELQKTLIQQIVRENTAELEEITERGALALFDAHVTKKDDDEESLDLRAYICLQQIANHPSTLIQSEKLTAYLEEQTSLFGENTRVAEVNYLEEGKLKSIMQLVKGIFKQAPQDKILIFTNFEKMGHLLCEGINSSILKPTMQKVEFLFGKVKKEARAKITQRFQSPEGPPALIAGRKLGSVGWNCTAANHVIIVDPWWNPNDDDQCIARIYRLGQTKPVHVYRMHQEGFVADDKMNRLRIEKKAWCDLILSADVGNVKQKIREIIEGSNHSDNPNHLVNAPVARTING